VIAKFLRSQWKFVLITILCGIVAIQTHRLSNAEERIVEVSTRYQSAIDAAEAATKKAQDISTATVKAINDAKPKLVEQATRNAETLYRRRYGRVVGGNAVYLGTGVTGTPPIGVRDTETVCNPTGTVQADLPESVAGKTTVVDVGGTCDPRFLEDAARAAVVMSLIDQWVDKHQIPRE